MRVWLLVASLVLWVPMAFARDGIVLESYDGVRPTSAASSIAPLLEELSQRGFEAGDSIGRLYEGKVSRPRVDSLPKDFAKQLKDGQQEYLRGNYAAAVAKLQPLIDSAHENSSAFAKNQPLRQTMLDGLIALALAHDRNGDPKTARAIFEELARSFPSVSVPANTWGATAAKQFADVQRDLAQQSQGRLIVKAPSTAEVYINERLEPTTGNVVKNLLPGEYRIFSRDGAKESRTYRVKVISAVDTSVSIDLDLDRALRTSGWAGFEYASVADRERFESKHSSLFANAIEERAVVVVGIDKTKGVIFGALVNSSGRDERRGTVALTAGDSSKRQLAAFLAGEAASKDIIVLTGPGAPGNTVTTIDDTGKIVVVPVESKPRWGGWPVITGIATLGAAGAAVYFFSVDGDCTDGSSDPTCPKFVERSPHAFVSVGAGAVLAGITVYLIVTRSSSANKTAFIVPTNGGAIAGATLRF